MPSKEELLLPIIQKIRIFQGIEESQAKAIIRSLSTQFYTSGCIIFHEGDEPDALYIIQSGKVRVFHPARDDKPEEELAILRNDDFFGEMALISGQKRGASIAALEDSIIFSLQKEQFQELIENNAEIAALISSEFMHRLEKNIRKKH